MICIPRHIASWHYKGNNLQNEARKVFRGGEKTKRGNEIDRIDRDVLGLWDADDGTKDFA